MSSRLDEINDWSLLANQARYSAQGLARLCLVSVRHLRRYFERKQQPTPHEWLHELRMERAVKLIGDRIPIKEAAIELGYKDPAHFTRDFNRTFGVPPSKFLSSTSEPSPVSQMSAFDKRCPLSASELPFCSIKLW